MRMNTGERGNRGLKVEDGGGRSEEGGRREEGRREHDGMTNSCDKFV